MDCIYLILLLIGLAIIGGVIDFIIPGRMPYGLIGGIVAAVIGGLIGGLLFSGFGPSIPVAFTDNLRFFWIPALLGGIILAIVVRILLGMSRRSS